MELEKEILCSPVSPFSYNIHTCSHPGGRRGAEDGPGFQSEVVNSCDAQELNRVFLRSGQLDSEV